MFNNTVPQGSIVLRLEFSIADAVHQRGLLSVLAAAIAAWWNRPRLPATLPAYLREDLGLLPSASPAHWLDIPSNVTIPPPLRRPGM
ncbi:hypothetical protein [Devosia submarina]|uniref:hypothetical protein n=1 Tax=Devosia submarina TaxID=1173082 RepID=UPI000D39948D|nr:hypothetical protein [Devosia submarina]